jgi:hypothetical protein
MSLALTESIIYQFTLWESSFDSHSDIYISIYLTLTVIFEASLDVRHGRPTPPYVFLSSYQNVSKSVPSSTPEQWYPVSLLHREVHTPPIFL